MKEKQRNEEVIHSLFFLLSGLVCFFLSRFSLKLFPFFAWCFSFCFPYFFSDAKWLFKAMTLLFKSNISDGFTKVPNERNERNERISQKKKKKE